MDTFTNQTPSTQQGLGNGRNTGRPRRRRRRILILLVIIGVVAYFLLR